MAQHSDYMLKALQLAKQRRGFCAPNPAVGAVIVKNNEVIAEGYHWASGKAHAEVAALQKLQVGEAEGASLYVTLEPCCHWGKTPPCTDAIIKAGITEVFFAHIDANPDVAGKGAARLQQAGIKCTRLNLPEISQFYASYDYWRQHNKPYITAKLALTLNGKIAGISGEPVQITGEALRLFTHQQRKMADAILTTAKTIAADDPSMNVRLENETYAKPLYILDSFLSLSPAAKVLNTAANVTLLHRVEAPLLLQETWQKRGVTCVAIAATSTGLNLAEVINYIGRQGVHDLWIEAGGAAFQAFIQQQLVQRAFIYVAPKCLENQAKNAFSDDFTVFVTAKNYQWQQIGNDAMCEINF